MSKDEFLLSIESGMRLTWDFFKRVYGFDVSYPGFADRALVRLETAGCTHARAYYHEWVEKYAKEQEDMFKEVAAWYRKWVEGKDEAKRREVLNKWRKIFQTADKSTLESSLMQLSMKGVNIESFVTAVQRVQ